MTTISVYRTPSANAPRAAAWASAIFTALMKPFSSANRVAAPAPSPEARQRESEAVRTYAHRFIDCDPGFAADLFAAADRHETLN